MNASSIGPTWDLTIAARTLTFWILTEAVPRRNELALIAILGTGASRGLRLYLLPRARPQ